MLTSVDRRQVYDVVDSAEGRDDAARHARHRLGVLLVARGELLDQVAEVAVGAALHAHDLFLHAGDLLVLRVKQLERRARTNQRVHHFVATEFGKARGRYRPPSPLTGQLQENAPPGIRRLRQLRLQKRKGVPARIRHPRTPAHPTVGERKAARTHAKPNARLTDLTLEADTLSVRLATRPPEDSSTWPSLVVRPGFDPSSWLLAVAVSTPAKSTRAQSTVEVRMVTGGDVRERRFAIVCFFFVFGEGHPMSP